MNDYAGVDDDHSLSSVQYDVTAAVTHHAMLVQAGLHM